MDSTRPAAHVPGELPRALNLLDSTLLVVGLGIGTGIFLTTGIMAEHLPSLSWLMVVWAAGGLLTLAGALTYAELGAMMPAAGGQYVYLREAYGDLAAFLFGWFALLVYQSGGNAALAVGFAEYFGYFFPSLGMQNLLHEVTIGGHLFRISAGHFTAVAAIILLTWVNIRGLREGAILSNILSAAKIGAIGAFVLLGFAVAAPAAAPAVADGSPAGPAAGFDLARGLGLAIIAVLWTYDGWNTFSFSAGEVKNPSRNIPMALMLGTGLITVLYLAVNAAYMRALPISEMAGVTRIAEHAAQALWGPGSATLISAAIALSGFGCLHGNILVGARVYYAMARDRIFFRSVGRVHPRHLTPATALIVQGVWSCLLTLSGQYEQLFTFAVFAGMLMYAASAATVFTLRRARPDAPRPYRAWGYPIVPGLYIAALGVIIASTIYTRPVESIAGLALIAAGLPAYWFFRRGKLAA
ncbi:MAG TPA: amino acid permease [Candidatus Polarisedimenticolia bacterium]|jgi:APA family basic amino acid/polyamine antiporter